MAFAVVATSMATAVAGAVIGVGLKPKLVTTASELAHGMFWGIYRPIPF
jgi:hypothetical protein